MSTQKEPVPPTTASPLQPLLQPEVKWPVFIAALVGVSVVTVWAMIAPRQAEAVIGVVVAATTEGFGWFYIALSTAIVVFIIYLALSRYGRVRLGPEHSRPEFSTWSWATMLFAAGIGTDVMFYSVVEPVTQYLEPPVGDGGTVEAARDATVWTMFHYGITGWCMYALMGLAMAYFSYRLNRPLAVRYALEPVFGRRVDGWLGHTVDTAAVLGTIFGVATSLGIGVVFLNVGLNMIFGVPIGVATQGVLAFLAVAIAAASATSGVDKGIRILSEISVVMALGLAAWLLVTGQTSFFLNAVVMNVGDFVSSYPGRVLDTFAFDDVTAWMSSWTLFFWAWWVAWASFVGLFLARISRGRTIRQFIVGVMVVPFSYIVLWVSIFGNAAVKRVRDGDATFAEAALEFDGRGFYLLLEDYPLPSFMIFMAFVIGLLFYVTSADSGSLVMGNLCSKLQDVAQDCAPWQRILWASVTGLLTVAMLIVGGLAALQYMTIIFGLPFAFVLTMVMWGLFKALRREGHKVDTGQSRLVTILSARAPAPSEPGTWRARLARVTNFVDIEEARDYLHRVIEVALQEVADELCERHVPARIVGAEDYVELRTDEQVDPFVYRVEVDLSPVPTYGGRMIGDRDQYARLEVHLGDGGQDYDIMGYTENQVIHDCLDQYERHLEFLRNP